MNLSSKNPKCNGTQGSCLQKQLDRVLSELTPEAAGLVRKKWVSVGVWRRLNSRQQTWGSVQRISSIKVFTLCRYSLRNQVVNKSRGECVYMCAGWFSSFAFCIQTQVKSFKVRVSNTLADCLFSTYNFKLIFCIKKCFLLGFIFLQRYLCKLSAWFKKRMVLPLGKPAAYQSGF